MKNVEEVGQRERIRMVPLPLQFLIAMIAYAINERMAKRLEYAQEEVRALKEALAVATGANRIRFTELQRRRLALKGKELTPKERAETCQVVRPETILAWFRRLVAKKYDGSKARSAGRRGKAADIRKLVVQFATDNPRWGYTKIRDALRGVGADIGRTTVAHILAEAGIDPAPERSKKRSWKLFLRSHIETLYACDFFSVEALSATGTVRYMVFFVIHLKSRAVEIGGVTVNPNGEWLKQVARGLLDPVDGFLRGATHLVHDRDPLFTEAWTTLLAASGVECVPIPPRSPNCSPFAERFIRTVRNECLDNFVLFGERHLRHVLREFVAHYHGERYHQGLGGRIIKPQPIAANTNGAPGVTCRSRLGGILNFYQGSIAA